MTPIARRPGFDRSAGSDQNPAKNVNPLTIKVLLAIRQHAPGLPPTQPLISRHFERFPQPPAAARPPIHQQTRGSPQSCPDLRRTQSSLPLLVLPPPIFASSSPLGAAAIPRPGLPRHFPARGYADLRSRWSLPGHPMAFPSLRDQRERLTSSPPSPRQPQSGCMADRPGPNAQFL